MRETALRTAALVLALAAAGCENRNPRAQASVVDSGPNYKVAYLFTVEGCKTYRFEDGWRFHYLTTCPGNVQQAATCGKSCEYPDRLQTVIAPPARER